MSLYQEVLVSYDIADNKNRKKLFDELKDMGLKPIQMSVFWGHLKGAQIKILPTIFRKYCKEKDKAFFIRSNLSNEILKCSYGYKKEEFTEVEFEYL